MGRSYISYLRKRNICIMSLYVLARWGSLNGDFGSYLAVIYRVQSAMMRANMQSSWSWNPQNQSRIMREMGKGKGGSREAQCKEKRKKQKISSQKIKTPHESQSRHETKVIIETTFASC
jgi:hypothetical protein